MQHDLMIEGAALRLRPIEDADAPFVWNLRKNDALNGFLHAAPEGIEQQLAWQAEYYKRCNDYYFVVETLRNGAAEGVISIYGIDTFAREGEWGRWILVPGSMAAIESAWLIYRCAFEMLDLKELYCQTLVDNKQVVSFHDSCGVSRRTILPNHCELNGRMLDAVEHRIDLEGWADVEPRLRLLANLTARRFFS